MELKDVKQGFVPSNQEDNEFSGIPGDYDEEDNWVEAARVGAAEAVRQGIGQAKVYWDKSTDGPPGDRDEQIRRLVKMIEWAKRDGCTHIVSYHSNVSHKNLDGTWKAQSWYPLINQEADRTPAREAAKWLASLTPGWHWSEPANRSGDLAFSRRTKPLGSHRSLLWEIGDHAPCVEHGVFLKTYREALGILAQWGFMKFAGLPVNPVMPAGVLLPPEWAHLATPDAPPVVPYTRMLYVSDDQWPGDEPYTRGEDVCFVQRQVNLVLPAGLTLGRRDGKTVTLPLVDDGIYGLGTEAAVLAAQKVLFPGLPREWDGVVGPKTWEKLRSV